MSLFKQIEQVKSSAEEIIITGQPPEKQPADTDSSSLQPDGPPADRKQAAPRRQPKPEQLKFLKPCSICYGREFTHRENGGFFCNTCQPGIKGHPVIAMGPRQPPETITGLPCAGCGSSTWTKERDGYQFPDGFIVDGWHCGGDRCPVKLLTGNKEADQRTKDLVMNPDPPAAAKQALTLPDDPPGDEEKYFRASFSWIMDHLPQLLAAGWTRPGLFRRSKFRWPLGSWGAAWSAVWGKPDLRVQIGSRGELVFTFSSGVRKVTQRINKS
jgi:hypothetical protein